MAELNFTVDTEPMADRIRGVNKSVAVVGTAVTAMEAAVIASERQATDKICKSIDSGFYLLMRSRLSQRIAQFTSTMHSRAGSMMETASSIDHTHQQMSGDFNRIKARYQKLFDSLNRALEQRVRELDRPAMDLAQRRSEFLLGQQCQEAPAALYYGSDTANVALKAANARVKTKAMESVGELGAGARQIVTYGRMTKSVMERPHASVPRGASRYQLVPVVYVDAQDLTVPDTHVLEILPSEALEPQTQARIAQAVRGARQDLAPATGDDMGMVRTMFARRIRDAQLDDRVAQTMLGLFHVRFGGGGQ